MVNKSPIFIAGTNGSGTRIYAQLLEQYGVYQGLGKNYAHEPERIIQYTRPLVPKLMAITRSVTYSIDKVPEDLRSKMVNWIVNLENHINETRPLSSSYWGWKHPRNMFILPFLHHIYPNCYFIHVVRDGRDMAFAENRGDFLNLYNFLTDFESLGPTETTHFWNDVNMEVSEWCENHLSSHYIWTRFEDLCSNPLEEITRIMNRIGMPETSDNYCEYVTAPSSIGRWQQISTQLKLDLNNAGLGCLKKFRYV